MEDNPGNPVHYGEYLENECVYDPCEELDARIAKYLPSETGDEMNDATTLKLILALRDASDKLKQCLRNLDEFTDDDLTENWKEAFDAIDAAIHWSNLV